MRNTLTVRPARAYMRLLPLFALLAMFFLQSCGTYHKVAVWYKYRNDYHLPKQQPGTRHTAPAPKVIAQSEAPATRMDAAEAPLAVAANTSLTPESAAPVTRKEVRRALRQARHEARQMARAQQTPAPEEAYADAEMAQGAGPNRASVDKRPVWERMAVAPEAAQRPMARSLDWVSILGFILSILWFLGAAGIAFAIAGLIVSIIGLTRTGPNGAHSGRGFAIAGIIMGAIGVLLWLLLIA